MMKKSVTVSLALLLAFSASTAAFADQQTQGKRRVGFFERLFGGVGKPSRRPAGQPEWWEDGNESGVRILRGGVETPSVKKSKSKVAVAQVAVKKKKVIPSAVLIDPEISEGLGMGNIDYVPMKLAAVFDTGLMKFKVPGVEDSAIKAVLSDKKTDIRALEPVRKAVIEHYIANGFKPLWTGDGNINERGLVVLDLLAKADAEGLAPLRYKPAVLDKFEGAVAQLDGDTLGLAQFDVELTVAAVTYALHQSGGAYEPERLSAYFDLKSQRVAPTVAVRVLAYSPFPAEYLKGLAPVHPAYLAMKAELATLKNDAPSTVENFEDGKRVRIGQKDARVLQLRQRLVQDGFVSLSDAVVPEDKRNILDKVLAKGLKRFQEAKGVAQTSNLDSATVRALNGPDRSELRDKLLSSMERLRWLPDDLGARHVLVNQASYRVNVVEQGKLIWASNVIVGKPLTQTAVFSDTFETVVYNPTWGVPESILLNEYLPKLRANPGYLDKIGFKVVKADGKVTSSKAVNWNAVGANSGMGIVQPAGGSNALGEIKFLFPNTHSIYMHDTPNRNLFKESKRNFSHGCVRVENPREFAEVLLELDRSTVDAEIDSGETKAVKVNKKTNVHLAYFTAWPDENGIMQYYSDAYGRDVTLKSARSVMDKLGGGNAGAKFVENVQAD
jgi:L,D-transpeptidase YcbB